MRSQAIEASEYESIQERAASLLQDDDGFWSFGELNKILHDECKQARENLVSIESLSLEKARFVKVPVALHLVMV